MISGRNIIGAEVYRRNRDIEEEQGYTRRGGTEA